MMRALPCLRIVGHAGEQPTKLDRGSELAALVEGGADGGGFSLSDDEHAGRMGVRSESGRGRGARRRAVARPMRLLAAAKRCEVAEASCQVGPTTCGRDAGRLDL
jgi:hypothetical protein